MILFTVTVSNVSNTPEDEIKSKALALANHLALTCCWLTWKSPNQAGRFLVLVDLLKPCSLSSTSSSSVVSLDDSSSVP